PYNSHLLFRFKDENRHFDEMTRWTELPKDGFGTIEGVKNYQFTNVHYAVEKDESSTELYIWTAEYGLAKYTITADKVKSTVISEINVHDTKTVGNALYSDDLRVTVYENAHMDVMADSTIRVKDFVQYQNLVPNIGTRWNGENYVSTIDYRNASTVMAQTAMTAQNSTEYLKVKTGRWNFISFPFDVNVSDIVAENGVLWVIRKYSGDDRAKLTGNTWQDMSAGSMLKAGEGYILHCTDNIYGRNQVTFTIPAANTDHHNGIFATNDVTRTLNEYPSEYAHNRSWNLIGNPYSTFYESRFMDFAAPITVWEGNGYAAYSLLDDDYLFHPNEAFFVQCPQGNPIVRFDAAGRTKDYVAYEAHNYYAPRRSMNINRRLYNFTLSDGTYSDRTRLVLNDEATLAYELERDASKFMSHNSAVPQLFSIEKGVRYAINERPEEDKMAWLGVYLAHDGTYTLSLVDPTNKDVLVTDLYTGVTTNIARTPYIFSGDAGTYDYRFQVTWSSSSSTTTDLQSVIRRDEPVEIYSMQGQKMAQGLIANLLRTIPAGVYLIKQGDTVQKLTISGK
ncbi:MAG: hypothetical protein KBS42_01725, partial [Bacteroidales bacterium]|nr:hypothetical protein [Candidatus Colicola coprequi]